MDEAATKEMRATAYNMARRWLDGVRDRLADGAAYDEAVNAQRKRADDETKSSFSTAPAPTRLARAAGHAAADGILRLQRGEGDARVARARDIIDEAEGGLNAPHAEIVRRVVEDVVAGRASGEDVGVFLQTGSMWPERDQGGAG